MKTILFDLWNAQPALTSKYHGGGEYIKTVFKKLADEYLETVRLIVFFDRDRFLDDWIRHIIENKNIPFYDIKNISEITPIFDREKVDIFYSGLPYYFEKKQFPNHVRIKGTIHGLRFLEMPADRYAYIYSAGKSSMKERIRYGIRKKYQEKKKKDFYSCIDLLDDVVCVSNHTRYSMLKNYPEFKNKRIDVFYTPQKQSSLYQPEAIDQRRKTILIMGGDRWIKNAYRSILAIEILFKKGYLQEYTIIVVGGLSDKIKAKISDLSRYEILDYVESEKLEELYYYCDIFLYASLNEGFGMPPLEAMKYGTTCIVSGVCSLTEICGEAVYYVNPYDIDEIATRILCAEYEKIDKTKVIAQYQKIYNRQQDDLRKLCEFIIK